MVTDQKKYFGFVVVGNLTKTSIELAVKKVNSVLKFISEVLVEKPGTD